MTESPTRSYRFSLQANGRSGTITCSRDQLSMEIEWEMSGVPDKDILLAPIDLGRWDSGQDVSRAEQRLILGHLRTWLAKEKTRANIERPTHQTDPSAKCVWEGCNEPALKGVAYCATHYDDTLLRK